MTDFHVEEFAILFQSPDKKVFLIDIPSSIAIAQELSDAVSRPQPHQTQAATASCIPNSNQKRSRKRLVSTSPLEAPYPASTEPRSESARAKVLAGIPSSEQRFHGEFIQPLVEAALQEIRAGYQRHGRQWCRARAVLDDERERAGSVRSRRKSTDGVCSDVATEDDDSHSSPLRSESSSFSLTGPPVILSSTSVNAFESMAELDGVVTNASSDPAFLAIMPENQDGTPSEYYVPPWSRFMLCTLPLSPPTGHASPSLENPIPGLTNKQKFNLILFDPPWPNRSVRRSRHYQTNSYSDMDTLTQNLQNILRVHAHPPGDALAGNPVQGLSLPDNQTQCQESLAAIWITNAEKSRRAAYEALLGSGFRICEEWIWIKTTTDGQPVSLLNGLWRKPYELLVIGRKDQVPSSHEPRPHRPDLLGVDAASITRRVLAAVPDLHSRKPNLKAVFEQLFFTPRSSVPVSYSALEVFARNLTAGWWSCGNEVLKFNARGCWVDSCE
ncbi:uncharacterized protein N7459_005245 [Penicillium hispanicum]|uniref:uncharacterized protein n=1 Tax=Penicillium hispanicum TaxID=1080232 RepID=UPI002541FE4F|nr:uncharacterized protein N7459_005245 [Penicillium hispanicum]KAJ5585445.1 hypothetical protein N7459_005245 [Penicillium hispanicum]